MRDKFELHFATSSDMIPAKRTNQRITQERVFYEGSIKYAGFGYEYISTNIIHGDSGHSTVTFRCTKHDEEHTQLISNHLGKNKGSSCRKCPGPSGKVRVIVLDDVILAARERHPNAVYDYSEMGELKTSKSPITVVCMVCEESFQTTIDAHVYHGVGCKTCGKSAQGSSNAARRPLSEANLGTEYPDIAKELKDPGTAHTYARTSHKKATWICPAGHGEYEMEIFARTSGGRKCPKCKTIGKTDERNLGNNPDAVTQWHPTKNEGKTPGDFAEGSGQNAWFMCGCVDDLGHRMNHEYYMRICNFRAGERCPYASGKKCSLWNSVAVRLTAMSDCWDFDKNQADPTEVTYGSGQYYWVKCPDCETSWKTMPNGSRKGITCPKCRTAGFSGVSIRWLNKIAKETGAIIHHGANGGEFSVPGTPFQADGYCEETNTIYEFHGTFWHGDPRVYDPLDMNPVSRKTYGELYTKTIAREALFRDLGYNLVVMWEGDFVE